MADDMYRQRIERAKELLATIKHAAMATVNPDGSPHNAPYFFMRDDALRHLYWGSHPDSQHSKNVERTGQLFVVLYEASQSGGLYIKAENGHALTGDELKIGLAVHNTARTRLGKDPLSLEYYQNGPQKMHRASIKNMWVNVTERDAQGRITYEQRREVLASDLETYEDL